NIRQHWAKLRWSSLLPFIHSQTLRRPVKPDRRSAMACSSMEPASRSRPFKSVSIKASLAGGSRSDNKRPYRIRLRGTTRGELGKTPNKASEAESGRGGSRSEYLCFAGGLGEESH